jgi:RNA polymerase sigma-70 factor, ECF subfamily
VRDDSLLTASLMHQNEEPSPARPLPSIIPSMLDRQRPWEISRQPPAEHGDNFLIARIRVGDEDAAKQLYRRYAKQLTSLLGKECSTDLTRCAGVEDIVQSVFGTFFRRVGLGCYANADGDTIWKVLLVIAMQRVRTQATYYYAAKRDASGTIAGAEGHRRLELQANARETATVHLELALQHILDQLPPRNQLLVRLRIEGFKVDDIAMIARRSKRTVERVIQHTRQLLGELLLKTD